LFQNKRLNGWGFSSAKTKPPSIGGFRGGAVADLTSLYTATCKFCCEPLPEDYEAFVLKRDGEDWAVFCPRCGNEWPLEEEGVGDGA